MPAFFTPTTPVKFIELDYEFFFADIEKFFGDLTFYLKWKKYWNDIFVEMDKQIIDYTKNFPDSNPVIQRLKNGYSKDEYEMFVYEHNTSGGTIYFHFDVEKMEYIQKNSDLEIVTITKNEVYIDEDTPFIDSKKKDNRLPYFIRMYGTETPFLCIDGNKRLQARIKNGQKSFEGYLFDGELLNHIFLGTPDLYFYAFLRECEFMLQVKNDDNSTLEDVFKQTQMYLQNKTS